MKNKLFIRVTALAALLACIGSSISCMTTYDSRGRPVQSVDPGMAVAGAAAAGLIGYAAGSNRNDRHRHGYYYGHDHRRHYYNDRYRRY